jgi:hypothetical protein
MLDYLVILEACYFESKINKRHHNREMVRHEIEKIKKLPGYDDAIKEYFHPDFRNFIESQVKENVLTPTVPSQPPAQPS